MKQTVQVPLESINGNAVLEVYVTGFPPIESNDIRWRKGNKALTLYSHNKRIFPANSNRWLVLRNYTIDDSGIYNIDINRGGRIEASAHIEFVVLSKYKVNFWRQ